LLIIPPILAPGHVYSDVGSTPGSFIGFLFAMVVGMAVIGIISFVGILIIDWVSDAPKSETLLQFTVRRFRAIGTYFKRIV
jgi:hypothetical protein